jgi:hypothetical protein
MGKPLGSMTPAERKAAMRRAAGRMQAELRANAGAIGKILDDHDGGQLTMTETTPTTEARAGRFTAVFTRSSDAASFYARLTASPDDFWTTDVRRNRANGRTVTWQATGRAFDSNGRDIIGYWQDMCETVGFYGSTFGEPPFGAGRRIATLNGRPCPASM